MPVSYHMTKYHGTWVLRYLLIEFYMLKMLARQNYSFFCVCFLCKYCFDFPYIKLSKVFVAYTNTSCVIAIVYVLTHIRAKACSS